MPSKSGSSRADSARVHTLARGCRGCEKLLAKAFDARLGASVPEPRERLGERGKKRVRGGLCFVEERFYKTKKDPVFLVPRGAGDPASFEPAVQRLFVAAPSVSSNWDTGVAPFSTM